jgi:hypothetical protein
MWPQCWDLQGPRGLEQRDLRNLNLGDLKKGPNGGISPTIKIYFLSWTHPKEFIIFIQGFMYSFFKKSVPQILC